LDETYESIILYNNPIILIYSLTDYKPIESIIFIDYNITYFYEKDLNDIVIISKNLIAVLYNYNLKIMAAEKKDLDGSIRDWNVYI
jgi:hypothetical protein